MNSTNTFFFTGRILCLRQMIHFLKMVFSTKPVVGAEVGVYAGQNALSILQTLNIEKLYLIDPYIPYEGYNEPKNNVSELNKAREIAMLRLLNYSDVIEWLFMRSDEAATKIQDSLDFVYIDANHAYDYVKRDIYDYYRLVKPYGYIGGHDYVLSYKPVVIEVKRVVDDFVNEYGYDLCIGSFDFPDWWVQKR